MCSLNQWVRSLVGLITSVGTGEYSHPFSLHAEIVEVEIEIVSPSIVLSGNFAELNRTVTCMVLKANDKRTSCPCHDEFRGPRSDYVRQPLVCSVTAAQSCVFRSSGRTRVGQLGNPVSGPRNVTPAREDRHLVRMAQTDRTYFSRQLAAQWSTATRVSLCASSIRRSLLQRGLRARIPLYRIPLTQNHRRLRLHWANVHRSWRADWQQVVFSDKSCFSLWHHDGRIRVRLYAGERRIPECIIERHSGQTPGVMV
ncbi:transposable element Tc1 transposase [Trichonephila clavipes]|nr:transposable element Tc1 transposase [Trichonephila clavipes]